MGLWRGGLPAPALPEGCDPLGVAPEPSRVLTLVLQALSPAETSKHPFSSLQGAPLAQTRLARSPLGFIRLQPAPLESGFPFSWTRFLTWALRRGSAPARVAA